MRDVIINAVRPFSKIDIFICSLSLVSVLAAWTVGSECVRFYRDEFPDVEILKTQYPVIHDLGINTSPQVILEKRRPANWITLNQVSKQAIGAILVSEDWAFYQHKGYDPNQIIEAIKKDWKDGKYVRGASTITQQVVRNVFLDQDKNLWRKLKEVYLATELEDTVGKKKILEVYLNIAEWGQGVYGIGSAAKHYFAKTPAQLTAKEGAFLAMLLPSPKRYSHSFKVKKLTDYAQNTLGSILTKMVQAHFLTEEEKLDAMAHPLSFERQ